MILFNELGKKCLPDNLEAIVDCRNSSAPACRRIRPVPMKKEKARSLLMGLFLYSAEWSG